MSSSHICLYMPLPCLPPLPTLRSGMGDDLPPSSSSSDPLRPFSPATLTIPPFFSPHMHTPATFSGGRREWRAGTGSPCLPGLLHCLPLSLLSGFVDWLGGGEGEEEEEWSLSVYHYLCLHTFYDNGMAGCLHCRKACASCCLPSACLPASYHETCSVYLPCMYMYSYAIHYYHAFTSCLPSPALYLPPPFALP